MKTVRSNKLVKIAAAVALGLGAGAVCANNTDTADFQALLTLITPLSIDQVQDLNFGNAFSGTADDLIVLPDAGGAAIFSATGDVTKTATISMANGTIVMKKGAGGTANTEVSVSSFTFGGLGVSGTNQLDFVADGSSITDIRVGATASIEAGDEAGSYVGTATVSVVYN